MSKVKAINFSVNKTYKLIGADGKVYQSLEKGTLGGHKKLKIYGRLDCSSALKWLQKGMYAKNRVFFKDEKTALEAGYRPCAVCMKEAYQAWKKNPQGYKNTKLSVLG